MRNSTEDLAFTSNTMSIKWILVAHLPIVILAMGNVLIYLLTRFLPMPDSIYPLFAMDGEYNLPSWFNSGLWLVLSIVSFTIFFLSPRHTISRHGGKLLGIIALYASIDEGIQIHEHFGLWAYVMQQHFSLRLPFDSHFLWVIPGIIIATITGLLLLKFIYYLPSTVRKTILFSGTMFLFATIIIELISGIWSKHFGTDFYYNLLITLEETIEMSSLTVVILALTSLFYHDSTSCSLSLNLPNHPSTATR